MYSSSASQTGPFPRYLIRARRLIPGTGAAAIESAALLVQDGRIRFAGPAAQAPADPHAIEVDASALTVMPGLIDGHSGLVNWGALPAVSLLRAYLQHGVTTAVAFDGHRPGANAEGIPLRDAIEQGKLRGCARLVVGKVVKCTHGHNEGRIADGPWEIRRAVREMVQAGADFIKTAATGGFWCKNGGIHRPNYTQEELSALVDEAHSWGLRVGVNAHTQPGLGRAIEAGADIIYHGCLIDPSAIERMAARSTWFIPALRVTSTRNVATWPEGSEIRARLEAAAGPQRTGLRAAVRAGVPIAMGSAGPGAVNGWLPGAAPVFELGEMVESGLTSPVAIRAATLGTAGAYRIDHRVGSLEAGKEADILCLRGDPLDDPTVLRDQRRVALVFQKGRVEYAHPEYRDYFSGGDESSRV